MKKYYVVLLYRTNYQFLEIDADSKVEASQKAQANLNANLVFDIQVYENKDLAEFKFQEATNV